MDLEGHLTDEKRCEKAEEDIADGISQAQKDKLRSKANARGKSEVQKWIHVYRTCFPNDEDIPSPCKSVSRTDKMRSQAHCPDYDTAYEMSPQSTAQSEVFADFEQYQRRELRQMLKDLLESKISQEKLEEKFQKELLESLELCNAKIMEQFQQQRHSNSSTLRASNDSERVENDKIDSAVSLEPEMSAMYHVPPPPAIGEDLVAYGYRSSNFTIPMPAVTSHESSLMSSQVALSGSNSSFTRVAPSSLTSYEGLPVPYNNDRRLQQSLSDGGHVSMLNTQLPYINGPNGSSRGQLDLGYGTANPLDLGFGWNLDRGQERESSIARFETMDHGTPGMIELERSQGWTGYTQPFMVQPRDENQIMQNVVYPTSLYGTTWDTLTTGQVMNQSATEQSDTRPSEKEKHPQTQQLKKRRRS
jgi:hypothetical protein